MHAYDMDFLSFCMDFVGNLEISTSDEQKYVCPKSSDEKTSFKTQTTLSKTNS